MIQVLKRAADIVDQLYIKQSCTLRELAAVTGLKKPTLHGILTSLVEIEYVEKADGKYKLGQKLFQLTHAKRKEDVLNTLARDTVGSLAEEVRESAAAAVISKGERFTIAVATFKQGVVVDVALLKRGSFYDNATGRILLAFLDDAGLKENVARKGLPGDEWEDVTSYGDLKKSLERIRRDKIAFKSAEGGEVQFLAVPVFGPGEKVWAAIGILMPSSRFKGDHKKEVIDKLKSAGERMSYELSSATEDPAGY